MKFKDSKLMIRITALATSFMILAVSMFPVQATKDVEDFEAELSSLNKELNQILDQMETTAKRLEQTKEKLAIIKGQEEEQYESMMLRIKYMYENGNTDLITLLFSSSCLPEFINRTEYISQVVDYDREMLAQLTEMSEEISQKEEQLLEDEKYLVSLQKDLDKKIRNTSDELSDYKKKLKQAKEEAERLEKEAQEKVKPIPPKKEEQTNTDKDSDNAVSKPSTSVSASDVELLAALLECEAGSSNYEALLAVGSVVVNRMNHRNYPDTVRGVIYQSGQFPPAHDGKVDRILARGVRDLCLTAAKDALAGKNNVGDCLSFRASSSGHDGIIIGDNVFF